MRVLLVEDDVAIREVVSAMLEARGHQVVAFGTAEAAWELRQVEFFPLLILDWLLPGAMDGLELCRRIRRLPNGDSSVVLMMTGRSSADDLAQVLDAGADDYLAKPFDLELFDVRLTIAERQVVAMAARKRAEEAQRFLAVAGALLGASLDYETTLANATQLAVPFLADCCMIDLLVDGRVTRVDVAHIRPEREAVLRELQGRVPLHSGSQHPLARVLQGGEAELVEEVTDPWLRSIATDPEHLAVLRELGFRSVMVVPLRAGGQTLGALSLISAESGRRYQPEDLDLARELAQRAALAVDNARLHAAAGEALRERDEALTRLRAVLEGATESIMLVNADGIVVYASPGSERITGIPAEARLGQRFDAGSALPDAERQELWATFQREIALPPERSRVQSLVELPSPRGGRIILETVGVNLADPDGRTTARVYVSRDITEREEQRRRQEALLRSVRRLSAEGDPERLLAELLSEAVELLTGTDGAVSRWDESRGMLVSVHRHQSTEAVPTLLRPGEGASGRAIARREPVILNDYQRDAAGQTPAAWSGVRASIAAPLLHEGRLLGALVIHSHSPERRFTSGDAELLEMLAGIAAATLVGLEHARLEGALLAARTAQHELSNQLSLTVGHAELLALNPSLPPNLVEAANDALRGAEAAAEILQRLQRITRLEETSWGPLTQPTIDIPRSTE